VGGGSQPRGLFLSRRILSNFTGTGSSRDEMNRIRDNLVALREAVEESYDRTVAAIEAERGSQIAAAEAEKESQLAAIEVLAKKLLAEDRRAPSLEGNGHRPEQDSATKTERVLKALSPKFLSVSEIADKAGLSSAEVSAALTRPRIKVALRRKGEPGSLKYALVRRVTNSTSANAGTTRAILAILARHPDGVSKTDLVDEVEKLGVSRAKAPRVAIATTIGWIVSARRARFDEATDRLFPC
jgi:hypothetical protein